MFRRVAVGLVLVLLVGCSGESAVPSDDWGLATVDLPGMSIEDVGVVFDSMPAELAGYRRVGSGDGEHLVEYDGEGPNLFLQSGEHRRMEGGELSPAEFLQLVADSGEIDIIDSVLEGDDVWLHGSTTVGGEDEPEDWTEYLMVWGEAEGEFLLWFNAMSQADLDAIIEAFVAAANG